MAGCKKCRILRCEKYLKNEFAMPVFWFGTLKDTVDFEIYVTDEEKGIKKSILGYHAPDYPKNPNYLEKYDWFCAQCYVNIMVARGATEDKGLFDLGDNDYNEL